MVEEAPVPVQATLFVRYQLQHSRLESIPVRVRVLHTSIETYYYYGAVAANTQLRPAMAIPSPGECVIIATISGIWG
eukprot:scaffold214757_cov23-Prasinocladus_malaysianus.AAC.2